MVEVVVMEDGIESKKTIKNELEKANFTVNLVDNGKEAVNLAKERGRKLLILDVNMGGNRDQEGLNTLEEIKKAVPDAFVSVLSAHPRYERMSRKLKADIFVLKSARLAEDVQTIISEIKQYEIKQYKINEIKRELYERINTIQDLEVLEGLERAFKQLDPNSDPNISAYDKKMIEEGWQEKYQRQYVAFVDGKFVDADSQRQELLKRIHEKYPDKNRYVTQVGQEEIIIDF